MTTLPRMFLLASAVAGLLGFFGMSGAILSGLLKASAGVLFILFFITQVVASAETDKLHA